MCCQPLPPPLSPPSAKLMIMALEEYGYQSRRGIRVPKKWRSSYSAAQETTAGHCLRRLSAKLMINGLFFGGIRVPKQEKEYGYQRNRGLLNSGDVIFFKVMKVLEMNEEGLRCLIWMIKMFDDIMVNWIEFYELMIDLQSIRDPESINF
ncbi:hypothetical protein Tco_0985681 [Tanacetum coccineum]